MKYEWRKGEKGLYGAKQKPELVEVPSQQFIVIEGEGNPNEADFSERVSALYSLAYSIKMLFKSVMKNEAEDKVKDFTVYPLEGIWEKAPGEGFDKSQLRYQLMIQQPNVIDQDMFMVALENVRKKKPNSFYDDICFQRLPEERAIQVLHVGSYDSEPASFEKMDELAISLGLERCDQVHREIYLSNKNRTPEEKLKTILRYSVR
ncbi:GyrI-like domain-containing protein [Streptococcus cristatus]|uniref:GyrI-like domain-containing protein n=1 Tax=Streptococcus cristatus TaxID=45634 RepID=UPI00288060DE|nr:GyrI-like domain-containing protein [Streptococcus cristatus]